MNIWRIAFGDLRRVAKDWHAALWLLLMPLLFAFIFGSAFRGGPSRTSWIPVIDLDRSELSSLFIDQMQGEEYFIDVKGAAEEHFLKDPWPCGVVIPAGFADKIQRGKKARLTAVKGSGDQERVMEMQACLYHALVRFTKGLALADVSHRPWTDEVKADLKQRLAQPPLLSVARRAHPHLKPPPSGFNSSLPGVLVMFVLQMIIIMGGTSLVNDRKQGQMARLMSAPVRPYEVYLAKILARVMMATLQAGLLLAAGVELFGLQMGPTPGYLLPVIFSLALFAGCLSMLCGLLCQNEKQVVQAGVFGAMFLSALGGCWWPIEITPETFQTIALATPSYWALHGLNSVLYFGKGPEVLWLECPVLIAFSAGLALCLIPVIRRASFHR